MSGFNSGGFGSGGSSGGFGTVKKKKSSGSKSFLGSLIPDVIEKPLVGAAKGYGGLLGNLATDIKDAVVGLPMGFVNMAKHPIGSAKAIGGSYWQTYSPLFKGDIAGFGKNLYDHPLGPILDVATVFTAGAAGAAKGGAILAKAGRGGATAEKLAALRVPKDIVVHDPKGVSGDVFRHLSGRAGRRTVQEAKIKFDSYLERGGGPAFMQRNEAWRRSRRYNKALRIETQHHAAIVGSIGRQAMDASAAAEHAIAAVGDEYATGLLQGQALFKAADAVLDATEAGKAVRENLYIEMHAGLVKHAKAYEATRAHELVAQGEMAYITAPEYLNRQMGIGVRRQAAKHAKLTRKYTARRKKIEARMATREAEFGKLAEAANAEQRIIDELANVNERLGEIHRRGVEIGGGARFVSGPRKGMLIPDPNAKQLMRYESEEAAYLTQTAKRLEGQRDHAKWARERRADLEAKLNQDRQTLLDQDRVLSEEWDQLESMKDRAASAQYREFADTHEGFVKAVENFGAHATTREVAHAMRHPDGRVYLVNKQSARNLGAEGGNSLRVLHMMVHKPTRLWKQLILGYTPRIVTNNGVGNTLLYLAQEGTPAGMLGLMDAFKWRFSKAERVRWAKMHNLPLDADSAHIWQSDHWLHKFFEDEMVDAFGAREAVGGLEDLSRKKYTQQNTLRHKIRQGFYPATKAIAEDPIRAATIIRSIRKSPEYKAMVKRYEAKGMKGGKVNERAIERLLNYDHKHNNGAFRERIAQESRRLSGDYITLSEAEKWARDIIPFYLWDKHILKTSANMVANTPGRVAIATRIGQLGAEWMDERYGEMPDYFRGGIPMSALGFAAGANGRERFLITASLNPWATPGQIAEGVENALIRGTTRGSVFHELNPFFTSTVESVTERNLLTGAFVPKQGPVLADVLDKMAQSLPYAKDTRDLLAGPITRTPSGKQKMVTIGDKTGTFSRWLGVPLREVDPTAAARADNPTKSRR